jgi:hypothetical protein
VPGVGVEPDDLLVQVGHDAVGLVDDDEVGGGRAAPLVAERAGGERVAADDLHGGDRVAGDALHQDARADAEQGEALLELLDQPAAVGEEDDPPAAFDGQPDDLGGDGALARAGGGLHEQPLEPPAGQPLADAAYQVSLEVPEWGRRSHGWPPRSWISS